MFCSPWMADPGWVEDCGSLRDGRPRVGRGLREPQGWPTQGGSRAAEASGVADPGWVEGCGRLGEAPPAFPAEVASLSGERVASWAMLFVVVDASRAHRGSDPLCGPPVCRVKGLLLHHPGTKRGCPRERDYLREHHFWSNSNSANCIMVPPWFSLTSKRKYCH